MGIMADKEKIDISAPVRPATLIATTTLVQDFIGVPDVFHSVNIL
jgi:hypothetical protein